MRVGLYLLIGLVAWWLFFRKKGAGDTSGGATTDDTPRGYSATTSSNVTLGLAALYFDPGQTFDADPVVGDVRNSTVTP